MVGILGRTERLKFTTIGDAVNVAARLERLQKDRWKAEEPNSCVDFFLVKQLGSIEALSHSIFEKWVR